MPPLIVTLRQCWKLTVRVWDQMVDVNLRGPLLLTRAWSTSPCVSHGGVIVNVASIAGLQPTPRLGLYGLTKAGMVASD